MPYSDLPPHAFWKLCRDAGDFRVGEIYEPKFALEPGMKLATAGSCFAQNIGRYIRASDLELVDVEPAPRAMPQALAQSYGYSMFSGRYGNVYTARQLRQLIQDAITETIHPAAVWQREGRFYDGLRPNTEPGGYETREEMEAQRLHHLRRVRLIFDRADVFVFTLGLTEAWEDVESGVIFPTAPGVVAGSFDARAHRFVNFGVSETLEDMRVAVELIRDLAPGMKIVLTVSPVPLTATATGAHVLRATTYSKSVLRAVAEEVAASDPGIDYFASYEIITGAPFAAQAYKPNLRNVSAAAVQGVMEVFFGAHPALGEAPRLEAVNALEAAQGHGDAISAAGTDEAVCEEAMLDAFAAGAGAPGAERDG